MDYTPDAATQAALDKSKRMYKTGEKLTPAEQTLLTTHSKRMVADMAPRTIAPGGGSGPYDYGSGTTGGYGYGMDQPFSNTVEASPAVQAIQAKNGRGEPLSTSEQTQLYDYMNKLDSQRGLAQLNPNDIAQSYQNFIQTETENRKAGMAPRPLPAQFAQIAQSNDPLGYTKQAPAGQAPAGGVSASAVQGGNSIQGGVQMPVKGSAAFNNMVTAGMITPDGVLRSQPMASQPYGYGGAGGTNGSNQTPAVNQAMPTAIGGAGNPVPASANPTAMLPFNPADATPSAPMTVHTPNGGLALGNTPAGIDEGKVLAEAELQKQLSTQTFTQQASARQSMLNELSGVLQKQQAGAMNDMMPGVYEDLNSRGLLRSSALGEKVGLEASKLSRQTSEQLALQGLSDRSTAINDIGTIENNYEGARTGAMQRGFSLEDFDRQVAAGKALGANALPQISQPSGKGAGALQGGLGGASVGATVGGPTGAAIGGIIGAVGGGKLGGK